MSKREDDQEPSVTAGYEVGYGKPPVATRFKPGQSGNPKGAKRKVRPSAAAARTAAMSCWR